MFELSSYLQQQNDSGDDNLFVVKKGESIWFCIADGSGGSGYGAEASELVISAFCEMSERDEICEPDNFESFLRKTDQEIQMNANGGESTAIVGKIDNEVIVGASVGDSEAWLYNQDHEYELTSLKKSKPLLGSGKSIPIGFGPVNVGFAVLMGSDGLFKYANSRDINKAVRSCLSAKEISSLAQIQTGKLQDDVSTIYISKKS